MIKKIFIFLLIGCGLVSCASVKIDALKQKTAECEGLVANLETWKTRVASTGNEIRLFQVDQELTRICLKEEKLLSAGKSIPEEMIETKMKLQTEKGGLQKQLDNTPMESPNGNPII